MHLDNDTPLRILINSVKHLRRGLKILEDSVVK